MSRLFWPFLLDKPLYALLPVLLLAGALPVGASPGMALPPSVAGKLRNYRIPSDDVSIYVQEVSGSSPSLTFEERAARNPASVIKLLTTLVALDTLGSGYTWRTEAYLSGALEGGRLEGDLVLKGYGDPYMTPQAFWRFVRGLRDRGLETIQGDIVLDESFFEASPHARGEFDGEPHRVYNALPHALSLNFQATRLHLFPDRAAGRVRVFSDPPLANLTINNRLRLVHAPCWGRHHRPRISFSEEASGATVQLRGSYSADCPESTHARLVMDPGSHVGGAFRALWREMGGRLEGTVQRGVLPPDAVLFHAVESRPLGEVVRGMNKYSNNLMSRLLFLTVGAEGHSEPGTVAKGRMVVEAWLAERGLDFPELLLDNGAGLSRDTRISAESLGRLLLAAYRGPYMPEFVASLAVAGVDGTLRDRFAGEPLSGRAHVKTGSLDDVSTMAGFVLDRHERRWVVVLLINHTGIRRWQGRQVQDLLLGWVYEGAGEPRHRVAYGADGDCAAATATFPLDAVAPSSMGAEASGAAQSITLPDT